jgi:hypothetical protein
MKRANLIRFVALSLLLVLWPGKSPAKEYVLTVGSEQLRFVPQGEKGYVVKQPKRTVGIGALAGTLFLEESQVGPIGGLDCHGIWIVENDGPASKNDAVTAALIQSGAAEYVAVHKGCALSELTAEILVNLPATSRRELSSSEEPSLRENTLTNEGYPKYE